VPKLTSHRDSHNITGLKASLRITGMTPASHADALRMAGQIEPQKPGRARDGCVALLDKPSSVARSGSAGMLKISIPAPRSGVVWFSPGPRDSAAPL